MITAAARAASMIAQVALELETESGETVGMALAGTHGQQPGLPSRLPTRPSDETITQANLSSFKATSKLIVSEELRTDEAVELTPTWPSSWADVSAPWRRRPSLSATAQASRSGSCTPRARTRS